MSSAKRVGRSSSGHSIGLDSAKLRRARVQSLVLFGIPTVDLLFHVRQANEMLIRFEQSERMDSSLTSQNLYPTFQFDAAENTYRTNILSVSLLLRADVSELLDRVKEIASANEQKLARIRVPGGHGTEVTMIVSNFSR